MLNKYKKMSVQAKAALWFTFCSILQKGISFITVPIFTRIMSAEQYGVYSLYLSWFQIMSIITSFYLYYGVYNNAMVKYKNERDQYTSSMQFLTILITFIVFVIYILFKNFWNSIIGLTTSIVLLMFIESLVTPAVNFWAGRKRFEYDYKKLVTFILTKSVLNPILGIIFVLFSQEKDFARIISVVLVELVFDGIILIVQFKKGKTFYKKEYWKYALSMSIPLLPHYLSSMILNQGDRIVISKLVDNAAVAFYSVAYSLGMIVQIFTNALNNSFTPWYYEKLKRKEYDGVSNVTNNLLIIIGFICVIIPFCGPEIISLFGSTEYSSAVYVMPPIALSTYFIFLYNLLAIPQFYFEKTTFMLIASVSAAVINVLLNIIFVPIFGYVAAGYTTLICYILYSIGHFYVSKKILKDNVDINIIFNNKKIFFISSIVTICGILSSILFKYFILRYIIIFTFILYCLINRKILIKKIKSLKD